MTGFLPMSASTAEDLERHSPIVMRRLSILNLKWRTWSSALWKPCRLLTITPNAFRREENPFSSRSTFFTRAWLADLPVLSREIDQDVYAFSTFSTSLASQATQNLHSVMPAAKWKIHSTSLSTTGHFETTRTLTHVRSLRCSQSGLTLH